MVWILFLLVFVYVENRKCSKWNAFCPLLSLLRTLFFHLFADLYESNAVQRLMCNSTIPTAAFSQMCRLALSILQWNEK